MRRLATALGMAGAALLALAGPASADSEYPPVGVVVRHDDGTQSRAIQISQLYPTAARQVVLLLDGDAPADARRMRLGVANLVDRENGCGRPESRAGDPTCGGGADEGELSGHLQVTLTAGRAHGDGCEAIGTPVVSTLRGLSEEPAVVGLPDDDGVLCAVVDLLHTEGTGDDVTQSDSSQFDLHMDFDAVPVAVAAPADSSATVSIRPATFANAAVVDLGPAPAGFPIGVPLVIAGVLLGCGATLLLVARRRGVMTP